MKLAATLFASIAILPASVFANTITVSGISSGAHMAQQFHTAFSSEVSGVGIIAGGPFWCAQGKSFNALYRCMSTSLGAPRVEDSLAEAKKLEQSGAIDSLIHLKDSRVYVLSEIGRAHV